MKKQIVRRSEMPAMDDFTATMIVEGVYECDSEDTYIRACQRLIDSGLAWTLQGFFGRTCQHMIDEGHCSR